MRRGAVVASLALLAACGTTTPDDTRPIPAAWLNAPATPQYREASFGPRASRPSALHIEKTSEGPTLEVLASGDKILTPGYLAIDSFDVAPEGDLAVFSAKRRDNFDIGLVATAGSQVNWVPSDPRDEVAVQWAPRGNKISYIIRGVSGDVIRSVHVHTAAQVASGFPNGRVYSYAWDARAERYAVAWSAIDASDGIEEMTYSGTERKWLKAPATRLDVSIEPAGGAVVMRPQTLHYNERLPLVVWRTSEIYQWDDARGRLQQSSRVAVAVLDHDPDEKFWSAIQAIPWVDSARIWVVGAQGPPHTTSIVGGTDLPAGRYRVRDNIVVVPPDVIKSFAAGSIADQLKGTPATNGSSR
ncbi:MAG TPA: hypothetical protein VGJ82_15060 [Thermoanaerobaculia bacterium]